MSKKSTANWAKSLVPMKCRECSDIVPKVDITASSVLCWKCTMKLCGAVIADQETIDNLGATESTEEKS